MPNPKIKKMKQSGMRCRRRRRWKSIILGKYSIIDLLLQFSWALLFVFLSAKKKRLVLSDEQRIKWGVEEECQRMRIGCGCFGERRKWREKMNWKGFLFKKINCSLADNSADRTYSTILFAQTFALSCLGETTWIIEWIFFSDMLATVY